MTLLYWLFKVKNQMPWDVYEYIRRPGCHDLVLAMAEFEAEHWPKRKE